MNFNTQTNALFANSGFLGDVELLCDNACPVCRYYAAHTEIKPEAGALRVIDARAPSALLEEASAQGLDVDEGVVAKIDGKLYHGPDAIYALSLITAPKTWFNRMNIALYSTPCTGRAAYAAGKLARDFSLWAQGLSRVDNLRRSASR